MKISSKTVAIFCLLFIATLTITLNFNHYLVYICVIGIAGLGGYDILTRNHERKNQEAEELDRSETLFDLLFNGKPP